MGKMDAKTKRLVPTIEDYFAGYGKNILDENTGFRFLFEDVLRLFLGLYPPTTFTNASLVDGVYTVVHGKGATAVFYSLKDPDGQHYTGATAKEEDEDTFTLDFGGAIGSGNWTLTLICITL